MRFEKVFERESGDVVKLVTLITGNVFLELGYEIDQFALVKKVDCDEWKSYHHTWSPKNISRQDYVSNHKPNTLLGVVSIAETLKAGIEAKEKFFETGVDAYF